jgi:helix-turn-helix resolvase-like protein
VKDKRANAIVERAIKCGELQPATKCDNCGRTENPLRKKRSIWAHHADYSKPLIVQWLCPSCHKKWHFRHAPLENYLPVRGAKKLTTDQIEEIRYLHGLGLSDKWIAGEVGCGRTTVWRVLKGRREKSLC